MGKTWMAGILMATTFIWAAPPSVAQDKGKTEAAKLAAASQASVEKLCNSVQLAKLLRRDNVLLGFLGNTVVNGNLHEPVTGIVFRVIWLVALAQCLRLPHVRRLNLSARVTGEGATMSNAMRLRIVRRAAVFGLMLCLPMLAACAATTQDGPTVTSVPTCSTGTVAPTQPTPPTPILRGGMRAV